MTEVSLDVRTTAEWDAGHKPNAMHFELARLQQGELPELPKDTPLRVYCRSGVRASVACQILKAAGFTDVENSGGF